MLRVVPAVMTGVFGRFMPVDLRTVAGLLFGLWLVEGKNKFHAAMSHDGLFRRFEKLVSQLRRSKSGFVSAELRHS